MPARTRRGFTLIEMLIVVVIVAILGAIAYGRFNRPSISAVTVPDSVVAPQASGRFVVEVKNGFGRPRSGVPVVFRVVEGTATISPETVATDSAGRAGSQWIAGNVGGLNAFAARIGGSDWSGAETIVTVRVDPTRGPGMVPVDSVAPARDTSAAQPPGATRRDTVPPNGDARDGAPGGVPDTALIRLPGSSSPLWAFLRSQELGIVSTED